MTKTEAGPGHNSSELTPDERRALHFHHFRAVMAQKEVLDAAREEYKRLRKLAKTDGITLSRLDFMMKCAEIEDGDILTDKVREEAEILEWFSLAKQGELFEDLSAEPAEDRAARDGDAAGWEGKDPSSPYGPGSAQDKAWMQAWHKAQTRRRDALQSAMEKQNAVANDDEDQEPFPDEEQVPAAAEA